MLSLYINSILDVFGYIDLMADVYAEYKCLIMGDFNCKCDKDTVTTSSRLLVMICCWSCVTVWNLTMLVIHTLIISWGILLTFGTRYIVTLLKPSVMFNCCIMLPTCQIICHWRSPVHISDEVPSQHLNSPSSLKEWNPVPVLQMMPAAEQFMNLDGIRIICCCITIMPAMHAQETCTRNLC